MKNILLVDNELESVESRATWLEGEGYIVTKVNSLSGAWNCIKDFHSDNGQLPLVLLDIMMPTIDDLDWLTDYEKQTTKITAPTAGLEFAEKLKKTYSSIQIAWHSVRHKTEHAVSKKLESLDCKLIQKDLQNRSEFIKEIKEAFNRE